MDTGKNTFKHFVRRSTKWLRRGISDSPKALAGAALLLALHAPVAAEPSGPTIRAGQVNIAPGSHTQIQQLTDRAIIDWNSFSIGAGESVQFLQPGELSAILNRVTGQDPSVILGQMRANGSVFLINPNGILFGPNSVVNVGSLVASSLGLSDQDFLSGNYRFATANGETLGAVVNQGHISVTDAGFAVLTGPAVVNEGVIVAQGGKVALAAGERATLNLDGRDLVHFSLQNDIGNGTILLAPGMLSEALSSTLGVAPGRQANQLIRQDDGRVQLVHSSGTLVQSGTVSADGKAGLDAGSVLLDSSDLTVVAKGSRTSASGVGENSDGGQVLVLSAMDGNATTRGFTDVQKGSLLDASSTVSGDAGFIEVSGDSLNLHGDIDLSANDGEQGSFLLDPVVVTIVDGEDAPTGSPSNLTASTTIGDEWFELFQPSANFTLQSSGEIIFDLATPGLINPNGDTVMNFARGASSTSVTLVAGADPNELGNVDFGTGYTFTGLRDFIVDASDNILLNNAVVDVRGGNTFALDAEGRIDFGTSDVDVVLGGGANAAIIAGADIDFGTSDIFLDSNFGAYGITTNINAGTGIRSGPTDPNSAAMMKLHIDGVTSILNTTGEIALLNTELNIPRGGNTAGAGRSFDLNNDGGGLTLTNSTFTVQGPWTADVGGAMTFQQGSSIDMSARGNITLTAAGDVNFHDTAINQNVGVNDSGGFSVTTTGGNVDFDTSRLFVDAPTGGSIYKVEASGSIDFGESVQSVTLAASATADILAGTTIDLGTSDIFLDSNFGAYGITTNINAGTGIRSGPTDPNSAAVMKLHIDGATSILNTTGEIAFLNTELNIPRGGNTTGAGRSFDLTNDGGGLTLTNSTFMVEGPWTVDVSGAITFQQGSAVDVFDRGDFSLTAGDNVSFHDTAINQTLGPNTTRSFLINTPGSVDFDTSRLFLESNLGGSAYRINAGGSIDFGESVQDVTLAASAAAEFSAGTLLDLGTSDLSLDSDFGAFGVDTTFTGGAGIRGDAGQKLRIDGVTGFTATGGDIQLSGTDLFIPIGGNTTGAARRVDFVSNNGSIGLGDSSIEVQGPGSIDAANSVTLGMADLDFTDDLSIVGRTGNVTLGTGTIDLAGGAGRDLFVLAGNQLDASSVNANLTGRLSLTTNGEVLANGSNLSAPDIEIYGFDPTTFTLDPNRAVLNGVQIGLDSNDANIDLSIFSQGDISVTHQAGTLGTGTLTLERIGAEGTTSTGSPSLRSVNGNITLNSDGQVNLGKGFGDTGDPLIWAESANSEVRVTAGQLVDTNGGNAQLDIQAGALAEVAGSTSNDDIEVMAPGIKLDVSGTPGSVGRLNIVGDSQFLEVRGDDSDIEVTELLSDNRLVVQQVSGENELSVAPTSIEGIYYSEVGDLSLGLVPIGAAQTVAVEALNGGSIKDGRTTVSNLDLQGRLILRAEGDIGETGKAVLVPGGRVSAEAGGALFLESDGPELLVQSATLSDPTGAVRATAEGLKADGDVRLELTPTTATQLTQEADITSTSGGVAIDIENGNLVQNNGSINANALAFKVGGNVGEFDAGTATEVAVNASTLVLEVQGDAILRQGTGDLSLEQQATVGGVTYNSGDIGGNLRVRVDSGDLVISTDRNVGGEAAFVTGTDLTINAQGTPGNIVLNGSVTTPGNLALLSGANIVWQSGTLTGAAIGLGAAGTVGTTAAPVSIDTTQLALNPANGNVTSLTPFTTVPSVTANGVTVNQGTVTPPGGQTVVTVILNPVDGGPPVETELEPQLFAQNNPQMVEEFLVGIFDPAFNHLVEPDPTALPLGWFYDEDFLRKKFRR